MPSRDETPATKEDIHDLYKIVNPMQAAHAECKSKLETEMHRAQKDIEEVSRDMDEIKTILPTLATKEDIKAITDKSADKKSDTFWKVLGILGPFLIAAIVYFLRSGPAL